MDLSTGYTSPAGMGGNSIPDEPRTLLFYIRGCDETARCVRSMCRIHVRGDVAESELSPMFVVVASTYAGMWRAWCCVSRKPASRIHVRGDVADFLGLETAHGKSHPRTRGCSSSDEIYVVSAGPETITAVVRCQHSAVAQLVE